MATLTKFDHASILQDAWHYADTADGSGYFDREYSRSQCMRLAYREYRKCGGTVRMALRLANAAQLRACIEALAATLGVDAERGRVLCVCPDFMGCNLAGDCRSCGYFLRHAPEAKPVPEPSPPHVVPTHFPLLRDDGSVWCTVTAFAGRVFLPIGWDPRAGMQTMGARKLAAALIEAADAAAAQDNAINAR